MKVYVYAEAYTPEDEYADIVQTKVFTEFNEACAFLKKNVDMYRNHVEDGEHWQTTYEDESCCHMIYDNDKDEVVMAIEEHEL